MKKKKTLLSFVIAMPIASNLFILAVIATLLPACNKHECPEQEIATAFSDNPDYWGHFNGTINDNQYDHTNSEPYEGKIEGNARQIREGIHMTRFICVFIDEKHSMHIDVAGMVPGSRNIKFSYWNGDRYEDSAVTLKVIGDNKTVKRYIPSEDNQLKLDISNVVWFSEHDRPYIEANLKGTLYEKVNSTDSITVDINFGI